MLQIKGNQPTLRAAIVARHQAAPAPAGAWQQVSERRSGADYTWRTSVYADVEPHLQTAWAGLAGYIVVEKTTVKQGVTSYKTHYYITSLRGRPVAELAAGIRGHWGIENKLHRTRDVHFRQDANGIRHHTAASNVALFNTLAINYLLTHVHTSIVYAQLWLSQNFKESMSYMRT